MEIARIGLAVVWLVVTAVVLAAILLFFLLMACSATDPAVPPWYCQPP